MINLPGFVNYRQNRDSSLPHIKKRGGGILVYVKLKLAPYIMEFPKMNTVSADIETVWLILHPPN